MEKRSDCITIDDYFIADDFISDSLAPANAFWKTYLCPGAFRRIGSLTQAGSCGNRNALSYSNS